MNFSVVLIAKNESKTLPRLIASLEEFKARGGQIILLDTGSTDDTAQIARDLGCQVHEVGDRFVRKINDEMAEAVNRMFIWDNEAAILKEGDKLFDYSAARNYISDFAPTDVIAMPDCDEVYTKLDLDKINDLIASGIDQLEYNFVFSHNPDGSEALKFMHCKFYNRKKLKWHRIVHEVLTPIDNQEIKRQFLGEEIIKLEHWQNQETNRSGYLRGLALDCYLDSESDRNWHYLGRELLWAARPSSAIKVLRHHSEMKNAWPVEQSESLVLIGEAYKMLGDEEKTIEYWVKAFHKESGRREPLMRLAEYFLEKKDWQKAYAYAEAALTISNNNYFAANQRHYGSLPHEIIYTAAWYLGKIEESKKHFLQALNFEPRNPKYLHDSQFYFNFPKVSILIPHMGISPQRKAGLQRCLDSIEKLDYPKELLELIVLEDFIESRVGVPKKVKEGFEKATGSVIVYASNDIAFEPDSLKLAVLYSMISNKGLVAFNTGPVSEDEGNICEHFLVWKDVVYRIGGEIFDTEFNHVGVDNLLWGKCKKINEAGRAEHAIVHHYHFSKGAPMDDVYKLGWEQKESDRLLLEKKLKELS